MKKVRTNLCVSVSGVEEESRQSEGCVRSREGRRTYRGEALVGIKSKGSQLRRQNIVLDVEVVAAISSLVVDSPLLTVGKDCRLSLWAVELLASGGP